MDFDYDEIAAKLGPEMADKIRAQRETHREENLTPAERRQRTKEQNAKDDADFAELVEAGEDPAALREDYPGAHMRWKNAQWRASLGRA